MALVSQNLEKFPRHKNSTKWDGRFVERKQNLKQKIDRTFQKVGTIPGKLQTQEKKARGNKRQKSGWLMEEQQETYQEKKNEDFH